MSSEAIGGLIHVDIVKGAIERPQGCDARAATADDGDFFSIHPVNRRVHFVHFD